MLKGKFYRINEKIISPSVRLVSEKGSEVLPTKDAILRAREKNLDLLEVVSNATPPVAKIVDFKKFLFEKKRREAESKKKSRAKKQDTKEFRFGPFIDTADLDFRIRRAEEFLKNGDKVKITVEFKGREMAHPEFGQEKMQTFIVKLEGNGEIEWGPERKGRYISALVKPRR